MSANRHVAPLGHIIRIMSQSVFARRKPVLIMYWYRNSANVTVVVNETTSIIASLNGGRRGRDRMVVGFIATYIVSTCHNDGCEFETHNNTESLTADNTGPHVWNIPRFSRHDKAKQTSIYYCTNYISMNTIVFVFTISAFKRNKALHISMCLVSACGGHCQGVQKKIINCKNCILYCK